MRWASYIPKAPEIIFVLFLYAGVYRHSPYLSFIPGNLTIIFSILISVVTIYILISKPIQINRQGLVVLLFFTILVSWVSISHLWTVGETDGLNKAFRLATTGYLTVSVPLLIFFKNKAQSQRLLIGLIMFGLLSSILIITTGSVPFDAPNYIVVSRPIGLGLVASTSLLLFGNSNHSMDFLYFLIIIFSLLALSLSGARMPFIAAIIISLSLLIGWGYQHKHHYKKLTYMVAILPLILAGITIRGVDIVTFSSSTTFDRLTRLQDGGGQSLRIRLELYDSAIRSWIESPTTLLIGHGSDSFSVINPVGSSYPHNIFLELAVETGIIALFILSLFIMWSVRGFFYHKQSGITIAYLSIAVYMFLNAMVTGNLYINRIFFMSVAILSIVGKERIQDTNQSGKIP